MRKDILDTNAIGQRAAGVVLPVDIGTASRAVPPFFASVQTVKGLTQRTSVFHRSLKNGFQYQFQRRNVDVLFAVK